MNFLNKFKYLDFLAILAVTLLLNSCGTESPSHIQSREEIQTSGVQGTQDYTVTQIKREGAESSVGGPDDDENEITKKK